MPLVIGKGAAATPAPVAPTAALAPATAPTGAANLGPLSALGTGPTSFSSLAPIQQAAGPQQAFRQGAGPMDFLGGPLNTLVGLASQPALAIGSLAAGHPGEALRHLGQIPIKATELAVPFSNKLLEQIPYIKPHENVFLSQVLRQHGLLPGGFLGSALGLGADVLTDPLSYVSFGAGGSLAHLGGAALERANVVRRVGEAADSEVKRLVEAGASSHSPELMAAMRQSLEAKQALRDVAGRGAHVRLGIGGTRFTKDVGTLPFSPQISRLASKVPLAPDTRRSLDFFRTGGGLGKDLDYRVGVQARRAANLKAQVDKREFDRIFSKPFVQTLRKLNKEKRYAPDGQPWTLRSAGEQMIHNVQGERRGYAHEHPLPPELEELKGKLREFLDRQGVEGVSAGLPLELLPDYIPSRMINRKMADVAEKYARRFGPTTRTPFFLKSKVFDTLRQAQSIRATAQDVADGLATKVGERMFEPETNLVKLIHTRIDAQAKALHEHGHRLMVAERTGLRRPGPPAVDVAGREAALAETRAAITAGRARQDVTAEKQALAASRERRQFSRQTVSASRRARALGPQREELARQAREAERSGRGGAVSLTEHPISPVVGARTERQRQLMARYFTPEGSLAAVERGIRERAAGRLERQVAAGRERLRGAAQAAGAARRQRGIAPVHAAQAELRQAEAAAGRAEAITAPALRGAAKGVSERAAEARPPGGRLVLRRARTTKVTREVKQVVANKVDLGIRKQVDSFTQRLIEKNAKPVHEARHEAVTRVAKLRKMDRDEVVKAYMRAKSGPQMERQIVEHRAPAPVTRVESGPMTRPGVQRTAPMRPGETVRPPLAKGPRGVWAGGTSRGKITKPRTGRPPGFQGLGVEQSSRGQEIAYAKDVMARRGRPQTYTDVVKPGAPSSAPRAEEVAGKGRVFHQRRARAAQPSVVPKAAQPVARSAAARKAMRKYFSQEGPISAAERTQLEALAAEEKKVLGQSRQAVERARKQLVAATRSADPRLIREARQRLAEAQRAHIEDRINHAVAQERLRGERRALRVARSQQDYQAIRAAQKGERAAEGEVRQAEVALARKSGRFVAAPGKIRQLARRELRQETAVKSAQQAEDAAKELRQRLELQPGKEATPEQWKEIKGRWQNIGVSYWQDVKVPIETRRVLDRINTEIERAFEHKSTRGPILAFLEKITSHWKALALVSAGYHIRNAFGDSIAAYWAGARNPVSFIQAGRIIKAQDDPEKLARMKVTIGGQTMDGNEFLREARAFGIYGQGAAAVEPGTSLARDRRYENEQTAVRKGIDRLRSVPGLRAAPGRGALSSFSQRVGQAREDATRLGTYLDLRKQGHSIVDSAMRTHTYLFDYGHVSDFIDAARRFWMPFITYTSKAAPRTLKMAATRPGYFSHHLELANALSTAAGVEPGGPSNLPFGERSSFGLPDPGGLLHRILQIPAGQPILWNPERVTPYGVLNSLDLNNPQQSILSNLLSPFVKTPVETLTGHRFYYAGNAPRLAVAPPLVQALHRLGVPIPDYGPKTVAATGQVQPGYSSGLDAWLRMLPIFSQTAGVNPSDPQRTASVLAGFLGGLPVQGYNRAQLQANAQKYGGA